MAQDQGRDEAKEAPEDWTGGDEPATQAQLSYLETLPHRSRSVHDA